MNEQERKQVAERIVDGIGTALWWENFKSDKIQLADNKWETTDPEILQKVQEIIDML